MVRASSSSLRFRLNNEDPDLSEDEMSVNDVPYVLCDESRGMFGMRRLGRDTDGMRELMRTDQRRRTSFDLSVYMNKHTPCIAVLIVNRNCRET